MAQGLNVHNSLFSLCVLWNLKILAGNYESWVLVKNYWKKHTRDFFNQSNLWKRVKEEDKGRQNLVVPIRDKSRIQRRLVWHKLIDYWARMRNEKVGTSMTHALANKIRGRLTWPLSHYNRDYRHVEWEDWYNPSCALLGCLQSLWHDH